MEILTEKNGVRSFVDESLLVKTEGLIDNDHERTTWVEYRFPGDDTVIHRSAHVTLKKWPDGLSGILQPFG